MIVSVVQIGNSRGVRLPKVVLDQLSISDSLDLQVENSSIILRPLNKLTRVGWDDAFKNMSASHDDDLILDDKVNEEVFEWEW